MKDQRRESERLRALLDRAAPADPSVGGRAASVRAKAKRDRRRNGFVGSAAIAFAALTVIIVPHFISSSPVSNGDTDPANGTQRTGAVPTPLDPYADPCPSDPVPVTDDLLGETMVGQGHAIPLRDDATLIRICPAAYQGAVTSFWAPPRDALTAGLPDFFADIRAADPWKPMVCFANVPPANPIALVVEYGADDRGIFALRDAQCRGVRLDGQIYNLGVVLSAYSDALTGQRAALTPRPLDADALSCAHPDERPSFIDPGRQLDLAAARICEVPDLTQPIESQQAVSKLAPDWLLDSLNADFTQGATVRLPGRSDCTDRPTGPAMYIVAADAWGDPRFLSDQEQCPFRYRHGPIPPAGGQRLFWVPAVVNAVTMSRGLR
jgi:hypothetical protein